MNTEYFKNKFKDIQTRIMITSITDRSLEIIKYSTNKYAICFIDFTEIDEQNNSAFAEIIKEIYLIDNLKTNLFIEKDILSAKFIDIFTFINIAFIDNCNVIILIIIRFKSFSHTKIFHIKKSQSILSHSKMIVSIYNVKTFERDYIFEFEQIANLFIYVHIIDTDIKTILIQNDNDGTIQIS